MTCRSALAVVFGCLLAACGETAGDTAPTATIDTLPNGAVRVRNAAIGSWDSASAWRIEELVRIGSLEGEGPDAVGDVRDIEVDAHRRVWILDSQQKHIVVFDAQGRYVRTVGRPGGGPGEIEDANGIEFDPQGRLWVQDPGNARFTVFDTSGALVTTHRRESILFSWIWPGGITRAGRVFDIDIIRPTTPGEHGRQLLIERDSAGVARDTFELPSFQPESYEYSEDGGRMRMSAGVPFAPRLEWRVGPAGTFWFGITDDYALIERTFDGDTVRVIEKEWTPLPVRPAERDSALGVEFIQELRQRGADVDADRVPATKPAWTTFWLDDDSYLWVMPTRDRGAAALADVFDPSGVYLGIVELPAGIMTFAAQPVIRGDRFYAVVSDELDVPYVIVGRLIGKGAERATD